MTFGLRMSRATPDKVNGKVLALADSLDFEIDMCKVLVKMRGKVITVRGQIKLERLGGNDAVVKKDLDQHRARPLDPLHRRRRRLRHQRQPARP